MASADGAFTARASANHNPSSPSVRRILREIRECVDLARDDDAFVAEPLEEDIFEWHFAVLGPPGTAFEGGIYHGRVILPAEYPFQPPSFVMLTANGRFETGTKICLSISSHHPRTWQPSWSVRAALVALRAFFPTPAEGAVGSLDWSDEKRRELALEAGRAMEPTFSYGNERRRALSAALHRRMVERRARVMAAERGLAGGSGGVGEVEDARAEEEEEAAVGIAREDERASETADEEPIATERETSEAVSPRASERDESGSDASSVSFEFTSESEISNESSPETTDVDFSTETTDVDFLNEPTDVDPTPRGDDDPPRPVTPPNETEETDRRAARRADLVRTKSQLDSTAWALFAVIVGISVKRLAVSFVITALES